MAVVTDEFDQRIDGDLLKDIILDASPFWMSTDAAAVFAEEILDACARSGEITVTRGEHAAVWHPDMVTRTMQRIDEVLAEPEVGLR